MKQLISRSIALAISLAIAIPAFAQPVDPITTARSAQSVLGK
jgi:hypothetical protein